MQTYPQVFVPCWGICHRIIVIQLQSCDLLILKSRHRSFPYAHLLYRWDCHPVINNSIYNSTSNCVLNCYFYYYCCSFNDLMQYPVFPWVINVYEGNRLDLNDVATYRKLNKPIACQKPENEEKYKMHYAVSQRKTELNIFI